MYLRCPLFLLALSAVSATDVEICGHGNPNCHPISSGELFLAICFFTLVPYLIGCAVVVRLCLKQNNVFDSLPLVVRQLLNNHGNNLSPFTAPSGASQQADAMDPQIPGVVTSINMTSPPPWAGSLITPSPPPPPPPPHPLPNTTSASSEEFSYVNPNINDENSGGGEQEIVPPNKEEESSSS